MSSILDDIASIRKQVAKLERKAWFSLRVETEEEKPSAKSIEQRATEASAKYHVIPYKTMDDKTLKNLFELIISITKQMKI